MKFFNRGKALYEEGQYVKAGLEFKNALQIDPKFAEGYYMLGRVEQKRGNLKRAFAGFRKAVALNPDLLDAQAQYGKLLLLSGATDEAGQKAEMVLAKEPDNTKALMLKASILLKREDFSGAIDLSEKLLALDIKNPEIYQTLAAAHVKNKDLEAAEKAYRDGIAANPEAVALHLGLVKFYSDNKQTMKTADVLKKIIELEPKKVNYVFSLANLYWEAGRQDTAIDQINVNDVARFAGLSRSAPARSKATTPRSR